MRKSFLILSLATLRYNEEDILWYIEKYTGKIIHIIVRIIIHSLFCVLSLMLPIYTANFAEVAPLESSSRPVVGHTLTNL